MRRVAAILLCAIPAFGQTWNLITTSGNGPGQNGWIQARWDPVAQQTMWYGIRPGSTSIFSTDLFWYNAATDHWTRLDGSGHMAEDCNSNGASWPQDRHPYGQHAIDTTRNRWYIYRGACRSTPPDDMWYLSLNSDPTTNTWTQVSITTKPPGYYNKTMIYSPDDDVLFMFGDDGGAQTHSNWVYCVSAGSPSSAQLAAGCTNANDWNEVSVVGGTQPAGVVQPGMVYDPALHKVILFGGLTVPEVPQNATWSYDIPTKTWTNLNPASPPGGPDTVNQTTSFDRNSLTGKYHYRRSGPGVTEEDWVYDPVGNTWMQTGTGGPNYVRSVIHDPVNNVLVALQYGIDVYEGSLPTVTGQFRILGTWDGTKVKWLQACWLESVAAGGTTSATLTGSGLSIPLTVQEALYSGGTSGVARTNELVCTGVPIPESANLTSTSGLSIVGAAEIAATDLATDGTPISIDTGAATFTIKKANHNGLDTVTVGGTTVVSTGTSDGFVISGPTAGNTTCGTCTTLYKSSADASSTCSIEENGPITAVVKCTFDHKNGSDVYMHGTARYRFVYGKSSVKVTSVLRNADYGASSSFASAYKGHQGYEFRLVPSISGTLTYAFGTHTTPATGTASGDSYVYQAKTDVMKYQYWCTGASGCVDFTADTGYLVSVNGSTVASGTTNQVSAGWADIRDSGGKGVLIGHYQAGGFYPKSLEFDGGGTDVRLGIWARQNSQPYYQVWPQWSIHDIYLNFHTSELSSPGNEFLKFQHGLLARAARTYYNSTGVFPYTIPDPTEEDAWYHEIAASANPVISDSRACCMTDLGLTDVGSFPLSVYRWYAWNDSGGYNQSEMRWSSLMNWLGRGMSGRYLNSSHFYKFQAEYMEPHSDGFDWRDRAGTGELDGFGRPANITASNSSLAHRSWKDQEHGHWYGMTDYYFLSGDETIREAMIDQMKDYHLNTTGTYQNGDSLGLYNTRSVGVNLMSGARFGQFLKDIGDSSYSSVLDAVTDDFNVQVKPDLCVTGDGSGCTWSDTAGPNYTQGVSRARGVPWGSNVGVTNWCSSLSTRINSVFQGSILTQGILEFAQAKTTAWADYWLARDLAYGISRWAIAENYLDYGHGQWDENGFYYYEGIDQANNCPETSYGYRTFHQTISMLFYSLWLTDGTANYTPFILNYQQNMASTGFGTADFGGIQMGQVIHLINNPGTYTLQSITPTVQDNGGGSYTLTWTPRAGTTTRRIKWSTKQIVDWVGYNPTTAAFTGTPATQAAWFAATNVSTTPTCGATCSVDVSTETTGLTADNFSVREYAPSGSSSLMRGLKVSGGVIR